MIATSIFRPAPAWRWITACALAVSLAACGDDPARPAVASVAVISGQDVTDTVEAMLPKPLVVEVRGEDGKTKPGALVQFQTEQSGGRPYVTFNPRAGQTVEVVADARGRASVGVRMGRTAGAARMLVSVPELGVQAAASYTVTHGAVARVVAAPADTAVFVGGSYRLRAGLADRFQNLLPDPVSYQPGSARITISASGIVTGAGVGRTKLTITVRGQRDSAFVSVVPTGTVAFRDGGLFVGDTTGIATIGLDGSGYRRVVALGLTPREHPGGNYNQPEWMPGAERVVYGQLVNNAYRLYVSDLVGTTRQLITAPNPTTSQGDPMPSRDGSWIYFVGNVNEYQMAVWRVKPDGTSVERVTIDADGSRFQGPTLSPDGTQLAYAASSSRNGAFRVFTRNLATGRSTLLVNGDAFWPRWSPRGDLIAYVADAVSNASEGTLRVARPDGSGVRVITTVRYYPGVDWSPDGRYLLALRSDAINSEGWEVIDVETSERIPLNFYLGWTSVTWRR